MFPNSSTCLSSERVLQQLIPQTILQFTTIPQPTNNQLHINLLFPHPSLPITLLNPKNTLKPNHHHPRHHHHQPQPQRPHPAPLHLPRPTRKFRRQRRHTDRSIPRRPHSRRSPRRRRRRHHRRSLHRSRRLHHLTRRISRRGHRRRPRLPRHNRTQALLQTDTQRTRLRPIRRTSRHARHHRRPARREFVRADVDVVVVVIRVGEGPRVVRVFDHCRRRRRRRCWTRRGSYNGGGDDGGRDGGGAVRTGVRGHHVGYGV